MVVLDWVVPTNLAVYVPAAGTVVSQEFATEAFSPVAPVD